MMGQLRYLLVKVLTLQCFQEHLTKFSKNVYHNQKKIEILWEKVILQLAEALKGSGIGLQPLGKTINKRY